MKAAKLRELDLAELNGQVREMEEKLFRIRFQMSMGQFEGLKNYRVMRKDRARVLGILRERELDPAKAQAAEEAAARSRKPAKRGKKG
jgi:large subunit ribosomal protein L29